MGLLDFLLGGGASADDINSVLASTAANAAALSNVATANSNTLATSVLDGLTDMVNSTLQTTFDGVASLQESTLAGSADAAASVAASAIDFTEHTYTLSYSGPPDSPTSTKTVTESLSHDGGSAIMSAYATHTLGGLTSGVGQGVSGMMTGVGSGAGQAMANLGTHLPDALPVLATALGSAVAGSLGTASLLAGSSL